MFDSATCGPGAGASGAGVAGVCSLAAALAFFQGSSGSDCAFRGTVGRCALALLRMAVEERCESGPVKKVQAGAGRVASVAASLSGSRLDANARAAFDDSAFSRQPGRSTTTTGTMVKIS